MPFPLNPFMGFTNCYCCLLRDMVHCGPHKCTHQEIIQWGRACIWGAKETLQNSSRFEAPWPPPSPLPFRLTSLSSDVSLFFSPCPTCTWSKNPASYHPAFIVCYLLCPLHLVYIQLIFLTLLSKATYNHSFTHRRRSKPHRATASSSGAVGVRRLAQGHLYTQLAGAGDRTSTLPVTSQPPLPPDLLLPSQRSTTYTKIWLHIYVGFITSLP